MTLPTEPFDAIRYLDTPEAVSAYLQDAVEDEDPRSLPLALQDVARMVGGADVLAQRSGLSLAAVEETLHSERIDVRTLRLITRALGASVHLPGTLHEAPEAA